MNPAFFVVQESSFSVMPGALVVPITAVHNWGEIIHVDATFIAEGFDAKFCKNTNCGAKEIINKYDKSQKQRLAEESFDCHTYGVYKCGDNVDCWITTFIIVYKCNGGVHYERNGQR